MISKADYTAKIQAELDAVNTAMQALEEHAKEARQKARDKFKADMDKLHEQSQLASARLEELKTAGEDSWSKLVEGMDKVRDAFTHSFHYFKSQV